MATNFLTKLFGSRNDRLLKQYRKTAVRINALEPELEKLSDAELEALGGPTPDGIPILLNAAPQPASPELAIAREEQSVRISWDAAITGFRLQGNSILGGGTWTDVPNVTGSSALVPATGTAQFFRLIRN